MNTQKDGGPAFPLQIHVSPGSEIQEGMTLRQWYKGQALALLADPNVQQDLEVIVEYCSAMADAMLSEDAEHARKEDGK